MAGRLAVLAGRGALPAAVIEAARGQNQDVFVLAFEGETDPATVEGVPHGWVALGAVGRAIRMLHQAGATELVMIGAIQRPALSQLKLDFRGVQLLARLGRKGGDSGDDRLLRLLIDELEKEGFKVLGPDDFIAPLLAPVGVITRSAPDEGALQDIERGRVILRALGDLDIGQAAIIQHGLVLGVEAIEGTDALIERCGPLKRPGRGGVLVKLKKPKQERRADLPVVGIRTLQRAHAAGLAGVAVHAGHCLMIGRPQLIEFADQAGLFLTGIEG